MTLNNLSESTKRSLLISEYVINGYFTIDIIARLISSPDKKDFIKDLMNWVDVICILPMYIELVLNDDRASHYFNILNVLRIIKGFRSFRYHYALQVLWNTLMESLPDLMVLLFFMTAVAILFAFSTYFAENNDLFNSIPRSLWWSFITMTTVSVLDFKIIF